jgi:hypothetical protein
MTKSIKFSNGSNDRLVLVLTKGKTDRASVRARLTRDGKTAIGCRSAFTNVAEAEKALARLAAEAESKGWKRVTAAGKVDAFTAIPPATRK